MYLIPSMKLDEIMKDFDDEYSEFICYQRPSKCNHSLEVHELSEALSDIKFKLVEWCTEYAKSIIPPTKLEEKVIPTNEDQGFEACRTKMLSRIEEDSK